MKKIISFLFVVAFLAGCAKYNLKRDIVDLAFKAYEGKMPCNIACGTINKRIKQYEKDTK